MIWVAIALVAAAIGAQGAPAHGLPVLHVHLSDRVGFSEEFLTDIEAEFAQLLRTAGVAATVGRGPGPNIDPDRFEVALSSAPPAAWNAKDTAMGVVVPASGARRRVVVFPARVMRVLGVHREAGMPIGSDHPRKVARAFARVMVHELVHAVSPRHHHSRIGLMNGHLARGELFDDELELDTGCRAQLRNGLRRLGFIDTGGGR